MSTENVPKPLNSLNRPSASRYNDEADFVPRTLLNLNHYASKKSITQVMLDLALLAVNASQLKYLLTDEAQEMRTLLLCLVIASICLQVVQCVVCIVLGLIFDITQVDDQKSAEIINNVLLAISTVVVALNIVISAFDMKSS